MMRLTKIIFYLIILIGTIFIGLAYLGPMLGFDLSTEPTLVEIPFKLDID